jgi:hypothetical protein
MRSVWVNYVTFLRDLQWLDYSLQSFHKYATGFDGVIIVVPQDQTAHFMYMEKKFGTPNCPVWIRGFMEYPGKGFVHHLAMKCYADVINPEATHILHMDPDCLFCSQVTPDDYFVDGKPVLVIEPYDVVSRYHPRRADWKGVTEFALPFVCQYEAMCRHPAIHIPETYRGMRHMVELKHRTPFMDFVIKQKNSFPQGFGEFNTLGSYAHFDLHDSYHFVDCGPERLKHVEMLKQDAEIPIGHPKPKLCQMWSYVGVDNPANKQRIKQILA